jgi:hypothetical protein
VEEEASLPDLDAAYVFKIKGGGRVHFVYYAEVPEGALPKPANEISFCRWVPWSAIDRVEVSGTTKALIKRFLERFPDG